MRNAFVTAARKFASDKDTIFLSGDLGFMALEPLRDKLGDRFINCGIAEQNMISIAAGLAKEGFKVFVYSIAPFVYARPFEQLRNDICFTGQPVCVVGNGGGYAYGHMGPTHHALEDCAAMSAIGMHVIAPAFDEDIEQIIPTIWNQPTYLRLGYDIKPKNLLPPTYSPWRLVLPGEKGVLVALGPLAGLAWSALEELQPANRPAVWSITELPLHHIPENFLDVLRRAPQLTILEEHVKQGGLGMQLLCEIGARGLKLENSLHRYALRYPSGTYGSQNFHRSECGLDAESIRSLFS
ncbi:MAG: hypothetical protein LUD38_03405 [Parabacteroides sp.]|nr:hypothetical protein [Parabacteroides sp.]